MKTIITDIPSREDFLKGKGALEIGYPWLTFGAIAALEDVVNKRFKVLEFGSGGSTIFWAENCKNVKSFETNILWYEKVHTRIQKFNNVELRTGTQDQILKKVEGEPDFHYDIVLVDSQPSESKRILFANAVLSKIKRGGWLIVDNYLKFGMENFVYPKGEIYTFDQFRYSGKGTRFCKIQ